MRRATPCCGNSRIGIESQVRASDVAARYGGEEFVVLLPGTDVGSAALLAERIRRQSVSATAIDLPNGDTVTITASIGICGGPTGAGG